MTRPAGSVAIRAVAAVTLGAFALVAVFAALAVALVLGAAVVAVKALSVAQQTLRPPEHLHPVEDAIPQGATR